VPVAERAWHLFSIPTAHTPLKKHRARYKIVVILYVLVWNIAIFVAIIVGVGQGKVLWFEFLSLEAWRSSQKYILFSIRRWNS